MTKTSASAAKCGATNDRWTCTLPTGHLSAHADHSWPPAGAFWRDKTEGCTAHVIVRIGPDRVLSLDCTRARHDETTKHRDRNHVSSENEPWAIDDAGTGVMLGARREPLPIVGCENVSPPYKRFVRHPEDKLDELCDRVAVLESAEREVAGKAETLEALDVIRGVVEQALADGKERGAEIRARLDALEGARDVTGEVFRDHGERLRKLEALVDGWKPTDSIFGDVSDPGARRHHEAQARALGALSSRVDVLNERFENARSTVAAFDEVATRRAAAIEERLAAVEAWRSAVEAWSARTNDRHRALLQAVAEIGARVDVAVGGPFTTIRTGSDAGRAPHVSAGYDGERTPHEENRKRARVDGGTERATCDRGRLTELLEHIAPAADVGAGTFTEWCASALARLEAKLEARGAGDGEKLRNEVAYALGVERNPSNEMILTALAHVLSSRRAAQESLTAALAELAELRAEVVRLRGLHADVLGAPVSLDDFANVTIDTARHAWVKIGGVFGEEEAEQLGRALLQAVRDWKARRAAEGAK